MKSSGFTSPYSPNTPMDRNDMLRSIGVGSVEDLFHVVPRKSPKTDIRIPASVSEFEFRREIESTAQRNIVPGEYACFLGAGTYRHFIPAAVRQIGSRGEYMTSYTPYQPEVAQGTLQTTYEFQTLVCQLTGMEVANAGMYDGATSLAEAALMSSRITKRNRIAVLNTVSPTYTEVLRTFVQALGIEILTVTEEDYNIPDDTACLIVQQPNFFGYMEKMEELSTLTHSNGALLVVCADPISLGMFKPPDEYDADIVVAEGQSMGVPASFGGPYVGFFACKERYLRQMPGRIVGKTIDTKGRTGYVLTLQAREQHIRRAQATSNVCTSVALVALTATAYMAVLGKRGIRHVAELCYHKAHYAASEIGKIPGYSLPINGTFFREFVVSCPLPPKQINQKLVDYEIIGGLDISSQIPNAMLFCVTDMNTREEIDHLIFALSKIADSV